MYKNAEKQAKIKPEDIPYAVSGEEKFEMQLTDLF